jgi:hypothetical protein
MGSLGRRGGCFIVVLLAVLLAGCTSKPAPSPSASIPAVSLRPASPSPSSTDPAAAAAQAAADAYRGMWRAYTDAGRTTNPQYDQLVRYADGDALAALKAGLQTNQKQGLITKGDLATHPQVTQLTPVNTPDTASIRDCLDTTNATRVKASPGGSPFTDSPGGHRVVTATVKNLNGVWKVISFVPLAVGTC